MAPKEVGSTASKQRQDRQCQQRGRDANTGAALATSAAWAPFKGDAEGSAR
jgi:hypothetical protein